ncbi:tail assembly chaperone [Microbacterium phage Naby]|uniref:Tail assembly chaperone n=1 Tax=Microbacterium phage BonaeVitae TaxID=2126925 RepID=A0A2R3ZZH0_9CAUD|nr:tail assembly chaperone [Microbacterium phage BonaeVitae]AVR56160.1 tail assembly chaperone [Microbacterium phage BonaeVitae]QFG10652.1 tail assembly chaperone [Microbacterium phage Naby]
MARFDFDKLTLGEVAAIEDLSGVAISAVNEQTPQGKFLAALTMVAKRRSGEPAFTFNQALAMPMTDAHAFLGLDEDEPAEDSDEGKDDSSQPSEHA